LEPTSFVGGSTANPLAVLSDMPKSEFAVQVDEIQRAVAPLFKSQGFRKRGRTYNRHTSDGLIHVVNFQMGASDPPGTTYVPGLRENLHGLFIVNLGVYIPEVAARHGGGIPTGFVQEYHCSLRARLGNLKGEPRDIWWPASTEKAAVDEIYRRLNEEAFPFFAQLSSRDDVIENWPKISAVISSGASSPWKIVAAIMMSERGEHAQASELLREQARETDNPKHREYVRKLAAEIGVLWEDG
jgi:hypothetical protein